MKIRSRLGGLKMARAWLVGVAMCATVLAGSAARAAANDDLTARLGDFDAAVKEGRCEDILPLVRRITLDARFAGLKGPAALKVWAVGAECAVTTDKADDAYAYAREATQYPEAPDESWRLRLLLGMFLKHSDDAVDTAALLSGTHPAVLSEIDARQYSHFSNELRVSGAAAQRRRLLAALFAADYQPPNPFDIADYFWLDYAGMLAADGDHAGTARALGRISNPYYVALARMDRRFTTEVAASPDRFNIRQAAERQLVRDRAAMLAHPDLAKGVTATVEDLRFLSRAKEALTLLDEANAKLAKPGDSGFSDLEDQANWLVDDRSRVLKDLGRFNESLEALRQGAQIVESGRDNVSQVINYAGALVETGKFKEALDQLEPFGATGEKRPVSPVGAMEMTGVRTCAFVGLGRTADAKAALTYMTTHESEDQNALTGALLCSNNLDGAEASFIRRLNDPDARSQAMWTLCDFSDVAPRLPYATEIDRRWRLVRDRPDVRAAIAAVGHLETIPLRSDVY
ncbi:MAG TPA: hypothetical protein VIB82_03085 [Caulobacteraceae bacterium]